MKRAILILAFVFALTGCGRTTSEVANDLCSNHRGVRSYEANGTGVFAVCLDGEAVQGPNE